jgi:multiple sugar transport system permease protein
MSTNQTVAPSRAPAKTIHESFGPWLLLAPCLSVLFLVGIFPLGYSLWISFTSYHPTNPSFDQGFVFLDNYIAIFSDRQALNSIVVTFLFTAGSVLASLIFGLLLAFLFNRDLPGSAVIRTLLLIPMLITPLAIGITWRIMYYPDTGVINYLLAAVGVGTQAWLSSTGQALISVIIVDVWQWTPFMFLILYAGLRSSPRSPMEAAAIDGASGWQSLIYVKLPMLKPIIVLAVLLRGIDAVRTFDQVFMMTRGGPNLATDLASLYLQRVNFKFFDLGYGAALSWAFLLVLAVIVVTFLKRTGFMNYISGKDRL